jgi:hypothetical protein
MPTNINPRVAAAHVNSAGSGARVIIVAAAMNAT